MIESHLTEQIIGGAIEVHKHWGPGLYEEIYERSLYHELRLRKVAADGPMRMPSSLGCAVAWRRRLLPLQTVRANLRLAIPTVCFRANRNAYRQSRICADLSSVAQCLCGEIPCDSDDSRMQDGNGMSKTLTKPRVLGPISWLMGC